MSAQATLLDVLNKAEVSTKKTTSRKRPLALANGGKLFLSFLFILNRVESPHATLGVTFTRHPVQKLVNLIWL